MSEILNVIHVVGLGIRLSSSRMASQHRKPDSWFSQGKGSVRHSIYRIKRETIHHINEASFHHVHGAMEDAWLSFIKGWENDAEASLRWGRNKQKELCIIHASPRCISQKPVEANDWKVSSYRGCWFSAILHGEHHGDHNQHRYLKHRHAIRDTFFCFIFRPLNRRSNALDGWKKHEYQPQALAINDAFL